jgi:hypothetical protein
MERLALPWGEIARQFTKLMLSLLSHIGKRDAKAELNRRSQACEVLAGTGIRVAKELEMVEHEGIAPSTPVWKVLAHGQ